MFMIISSITLFLFNNPHAVAADNGIALSPIPVTLNVTELDVVAKTTNISNDFNIVVTVLYFLYIFLDLLFLVSKYVINSLMLLIWLLKLFMSFNFFSHPCSKS